MLTRRGLFLSSVSHLAAAASGFVGGTAARSGALATLRESYDPQELAQIGAAIRQGHLPLPVKWIKRHDEITRKHNEQTIESVARLKKRYESPVMGRVPINRLFRMLAMCIDETDASLGMTNQYVHTLQVYFGMKKDGVDDEKLLLAALLHDIGKVLLLGAESPENVVCVNRPIERPLDQAGLDQVTFQWNHDEFAYSRLVGHVPDEVAWIVRYHSMELTGDEAFLTYRDRQMVKQWMIPFGHYDEATKEPFDFPPRETDEIRHLLHKYFPKGIVV